MSRAAIPDELMLPRGKLLEGIVTTLNHDRSARISPMGPIVDADFHKVTVAPVSFFQHVPQTSVARGKGFST